MNVFVGIPLPESLQREIAEWEKKFARLPVRWIAGRDLHVTLIPPWEAEKIPALALHAKPFDIYLSHAHYGPSQKKPRLIWAEGVASDALKNVQKDLERALGKDSGYELLRFHVTLARFPEEAFKEFPVKEIDEHVSWRIPVERIVVYEERETRSP